MSAKRRHKLRARRVAAGEWVDELLLTGEVPDGQNPFAKFDQIWLSAEWNQRRERLLAQHPRENIWAARMFDRPIPAVNSDRSKP
jgi:hypothetical protein